MDGDLARPSTTGGSMGAGRRMIVGGNWKCNLTHAQALELADQLNTIHVGDVEVVVTPTLLHLVPVQAKLKRAVGVGAQNCGFTGMGAYTGDVSAEHLANLDVPWVILGHSERRTHFGEDDALLAQKLEHALGAGLRVIFCVGEQKAEREAGKTLDVCKAQLEKVAPLLDPARVVIAYEPVWAIGARARTPATARAPGTACPAGSGRARARLLRWGWRTRRVQQQRARAG